MREKYIMEDEIKEKTEEEGNIELIKSVIKTKINLDTARKELWICRRRVNWLLCISNKSWAVKIKLFIKKSEK